LNLFVRSVINAGIVLHLYICEMTGLGRSWYFEIKTLHEVSRPRTQTPGLETKILVTMCWEWDQDWGLQVLSKLEFETLGLEITSLVQTILSNCIQWF